MTEVFRPEHIGGNVAVCSKCDKAFVDNNYYEYCPRCGCRIRESNIKISEDINEQTRKTSST